MDAFIFSMASPASFAQNRHASNAKCDSIRTLLFVLVSQPARLPATDMPTSTGGIRQNLFFKNLLFSILKNYMDMHRARAAHARSLAPRAKVGGMSQL